MIHASFLIMPSFGGMLYVSSPTTTIKLFFPWCYVSAPEQKFYFVWKDMRINAVQKPQKVMGRHRHVSQTVTIGFNFHGVGGIEESTLSCPGLFARPVAVTE